MLGSILCLAGASRINSTQFEIAEYGVEWNDRITAYREPVRDALMLRAQRNLSQEKVFAVADHWIRLRRTKQLVDVPQMVPGDGSRDGAKEQILAARDLVIYHLRRIASEKNPSTTDQVRAEALVKSILLAEVMKSADTASFNSACRVQLKSIQQLRTLPVQETPQFYLALEICGNEADQQRLLRSTYLRQMNLVLDKKQTPEAQSKAVFKLLESGTDRFFSEEVNKIGLKDDLRIDLGVVVASQEQCEGELKKLTNEVRQLWASSGKAPEHLVSFGF